MNLPTGLQLARVHTLTITRPDQSTPVVVDGFLQQPTSLVIADVEASVQPATPNEIKQLPEGDVYTSVYAVYTETEMKMRDRVTWNGEDYTVLKVFPWNMPTFECSHYKALMEPLRTTNAN